MCNNDLCKLTAEQIALYATTIAIEQSKNLNCEEISALQNLYGQICSSLSTIKCHKLFLEKHCCKKKDDKN